MGDLRSTRPITSPDIPVSAELMCRAIALALENVRCARGGPFAALVAKDGKVIAEGANSVTATNDPTAHAEIVAIRAACKALGNFQLTGCDLYTTCEPCPMCLGAIYWARPARVFYAGAAADAADAGFDDAFIYEELQRPPESRRIPMIQLMREESLAVFAAWKQQANKTKY
ncbi:MAG: tRNA-specific adenosine deaminase [Candidatus Acidoferrum typicum]|nr:tRNA-specific adenosine deaminase [Candidatus Acidoferrum typicum]